MIEKVLKFQIFTLKEEKKCICNEKAVIVPEVENNCHVCSHIYNKSKDFFFMKHFLSAVGCGPIPQTQPVLWHLPELN